MLDGSGNWQRTNIYGGGELLATMDQQPNPAYPGTQGAPQMIPALHYHLTDPLGTRRLQADAEGVPEIDCQSLPFGDQLNCFTDPNGNGNLDDSTPLHFTGKERDTETGEANGNDYFGARYFASGLGRFMTPDWSAKYDPVPYAKLDNPQTLNLYASPANPSGKVFTLEETQQVAAVCQDHDLFLFTDEIYEYFVYDGQRHIAPATLPGMRERTVVISGFSKTFSVTGWRLGYVTADARWMGALAYFHDLTYVCAPSALQHGAAAGLEQLPPSFYQQIAADHQAKRERLVSALRDAGLEPSVPAGAYYILADVSRLPGATAAEKARKLLAATGVAAVAGSAFFRAGQDGRGENLLRFCFAKKDAELDEACARLRTL